jgi:hypothetical protein
MIFRAALMPSVLVAITLTGAGCSATDFATVDSAFTATKSSAVVASNVTLPAAAIAASLAGIELVKSLAAASASTSMAPALFRLEALSSQEADVDNVDSKVKMHVIYSSSLAADGSLNASVSSFKGTAQGYTVDASGSFSLTPGSAGGTGSTVAYAMNGSLAYGSSSFNLKKLDFATSFPLPTSNATLGSCAFQQLDGTTVKSELTAALAVDANGKIVASGNLVQDGKTTPLTDFGQAFISAAVK